jgi:hypothetical protein
MRARLLSQAFPVFSALTCRPPCCLLLVTENALPIEEIASKLGFVLYCVCRTLLK